MVDISIANTESGVRLCELAEVISGVFVKSVPAGQVLYIQMKDLMVGAPGATAARIDYTPKLERYMLRRGDLLFAGKGTTYLCQVFLHDVPAIPSTTLYIIRPTSERITAEYLCWYLNHPKVVATVKAGQAGSSTLMVHKSTLEGLRVIVPDLATQHRMVELHRLQQREKQLLESLAEKKVQLTDQLLFDEIIKKSTI